MIINRKPARPPFYSRVKIWRFSDLCAKPNSSELWHLAPFSLSSLDIYRNTARQGLARPLGLIYPQQHTKRRQYLVRTGWPFTLYVLSSPVMCPSPEDQTASRSGFGRGRSMSAKQFTYIPQPERLSQVREDVNACLEDAGWEITANGCLCLGRSVAQTSSDMDLAITTSDTQMILAHHRMS